MPHHIHSLHHLTATTNDAQEDLDFYRQALGLRLVKQTVNFDNHHVFHFYYGNEQGEPSTIMTTFPYKGHNVRDGKKGSGQVTHTAFAVPSGSRSAWEARLQQHGISYQNGPDRFGEWVLSFDDPSGLQIELIGTDRDTRQPWTSAEISADMAIYGLHSVTAIQNALPPSRQLLEEVLGFRFVGQEGDRYRFETGAGGSGHQVDFLVDADQPKGLNGIGTVHHVALAIDNEPNQLALRQDLVAQGYKVTEVLDRNYFRSIYFREPGGVLYEVATIPPGFAVDEPVEALGESLKLPEWEEPNRSEIEAHLPDVK